MFYNDRPIESVSEDKLNRFGFAKRVADAIYNMKNEDTFTIGLYGKWGSGKTSVINMMLNELESRQLTTNESDKIVTVRFEPWNFTDSNQLLNQFFLRLSSQLCSKGDKALNAIGNALINYSDAFEMAEAVPVVGGLLAILGKKGAIAIGKRLRKGSEDDDIQNQKEAVINLLKGQQYKILIIIDDIDRLSNDKIRQVFQLIASVANFPNTIYIVAFDKDIVVSALKDVQYGSGEAYLEKIIQMPIQIPDITESRLLSVLSERLEYVLTNNRATIFDEQHWRNLFETCVKPFIKSIRDANRLCNYVEFKLSAIASEVNFADMVAITAIEIAVPQIYSWIKYHKSILTGGFDFSDMGKRKTPSEYRQQYTREFEEIEKYSEYPSQVDSETILLALSYLFPSFGSKIQTPREVINQRTQRSNCYIGNEDKFDRYFDLDMDNVGIKKADALKAVFTLSSSELQDYILECEKSGSGRELLKEIDAMIGSLDCERAKLIIEALLNTIPELNEYSSHGLIYSSSGDYAEHKLLDLIAVVPEKDRYATMSQFVRDADSITIQPIAVVINLIELGYGRLSANGAGHERQRVISLNELERLEHVFIDRVKELLSSQNLLDFADWRMIYHLMTYFQPEFMNDYLKKAFQDNANIVKYLTYTVSTWTGSSISYEVKNDYEKHLTKERILQAIESLAQSGELFKLKAKVQDKAAAFYLDAHDKLTDLDSVDKRDVDIQLAEWKSNLAERTP